MLDLSKALPRDRLALIRIKKKYHGIITGQQVEQLPIEDQRLLERACKMKAIRQDTWYSPSYYGSAYYL